MAWAPHPAPGAEEDGILLAGLCCCCLFFKEADLPLRVRNGSEESKGKGNGERLKEEEGER